MPRSLTGALPATLDLEAERLGHICLAALRRDSRPSYIHWKTYGGRDIIITIKRREGNARQDQNRTTVYFTVRLSDTVNADPAKFNHISHGTFGRYEWSSELRPEWNDEGFTAVVKELMLWACETASKAFYREECCQWFTQHVYTADAPAGARERAESISLDTTTTLRYRDMSIEDVGFWLSDPIKQQILGHSADTGDEMTTAGPMTPAPSDRRTWSRRRSATYNHRCECSECGFNIYMVQHVDGDISCPSCTGTMCWRVGLE